MHVRFVRLTYWAILVAVSIHRGNTSTLIHAYMHVACQQHQANLKFKCIVNTNL